MANSRKIEYQNFDLQKVKVSKDGLDIHFFEKGGTGDKHLVECTGQPHPDFTNALEKLKTYFAMRIGLLKGWDFAREELRGDSDKLKEAIAGYNAEVERCSVSGIVFVGSDQLSGIKITGSLKCEMGAVGMATPNITFASDKLGYENDVDELCETIKSETYLYHFKNKRAQQDLLDQVEEAENGEFELKGDETDGEQD